MPSFLIEPLEPRLLLSGTPTPQIEAAIVPQAENTTQIVTPTPSAQSVAKNSPVSVRVDYSTGILPEDQDLTLGGLFLKLHFSSSQLQPGADLITGLLETFLETPDASIVPENDSLDLDGDPDTDKFISVGWIDLLADEWPGEAADLLDGVDDGVVPLFTANFTTTSAFTGTQIKFSGITSTNQSLQKSSATISLAVAQGPVLNPIGPKTVVEGTRLSFPVSATDPAGGVVTLSATNPPAGATFVDDGDPATANTFIFSWTPTEAQGPGSFPVTFRATNPTTNAFDEEVVTISVTDPPLQLLAGANGVAATSSRVVLTFNRPVDPSVLSLYDATPGGFGAADVALVGAATGAVSGSLILSEDGLTATFMKTGGIDLTTGQTVGLLQPDTYTLTLRSATNGFKDKQGGLLDGDGNSVTGDDAVRTIVVASSTAVTVSVPDFARGPGQSVVLPFPAGTGIPVSVSNGDQIAGASFTITYDPDLLTITQVTKALGLPADATLQANLTVPGQAQVIMAFPTALAAGARDLVNLIASVPANGEIYRQKQAVTISNLSLVRSDSSVIQSVADDGVHIVAYVGDTDGTGDYGVLDAQRILRNLVELDSGLAAYRSGDPDIIGDITGGGLDVLDAQRILRHIVELPVTEIPILPGLTIPNPPAASGPDPNVVLTPKTGSPNSTVRVDLQLNPSPAGDATGLAGVQIELRYDPTILDVVATSSVLNGALIANEDGFVSTRNVNRTTGRVLYSAAWNEPLSGGTGMIVSVNFLIRPGVTASSATIDLFRADLVTNTPGVNLTLVPAIQPNVLGDATDSVITITQPDADNDGVSDPEENASGVLGAVNNASVAALRDAQGQFVRFEAPAGLSFRNMRLVGNPSPSDAPAGVTFPNGFFDFDLIGLAPGGETNIVMTLPAGSTANSYYRFGPTPDNPTPHWFNFAFDGTTGASVDVEFGEVTLFFKDGARGDDDLTANGTISDAGGPGIDPNARGIIAGQKFEDLNGDGFFDLDESGLNGWTIFLDLDGDFQLDPGEPTTLTQDLDIDGNGVIDPLTESGVYLFLNLPAGQYFVGEDVNSFPGFVQTAPGNSESPAEYVINLVAGDLAADGYDFGNRQLVQAASISGVKFLDLDVDGVRDAGEPGLPGVLIGLDLGNDGITEQFATTGTDGSYLFAGMAPGTHRVSEIVPEGFVQTAPAAGFYLVTITGTESVTDRDFGNVQAASISGRKFLDVNGNAIVDAPSDTPFNGVTINLDRGDDGIIDDTEITGQSGGLGDGFFFFGNLLPGTYRITEVVPSGHTQTGPVGGSFLLTLTAGQSVNGLFFFNQPVQQNQPPVITSNGGGDTAAVNVPENTTAVTTVTATDPNNDSIVFAIVGGADAGKFTIGTTSGALSFLAAPDFENPTDDGGNNVYDVIVRASDTFGAFDTQAIAVTVTDVVETGTLSGVKFDDWDGDGVRDAGEPGLPDWTIILDLDFDGGIDAQAITDANGFYQFTNVGPGTHALTELLQPGWTRTTQELVLVSPTNGQSIANLNFGNFRLGTISGVKFDDLDADGLRDAGEPGLEGWTIQLDKDNNGTIEATTTTAADGSYSFASLGPGVYAVREVAQAGWAQTSPEFTVVLTPEAEVPANNPATAKTGFGYGSFALDEATNTVSFEINFGQLAGTTVTGLHIHAGAVGAAGGIIYNLGNLGGLANPSKGTFTLVNNPNGSGLTIADQLSRFQAGTLYVNLHTNVEGDGEIRGQILPGTAHLVSVRSGLNAGGRDFGNDNLPPVANADSYTTAEDTSLVVPGAGLLPTLLANDGTLLAGEVVTVTLVSGPTNGVLSGVGNDGSFTYTPNLNVNGADSFVYRVTDDHGQSSEATVTITITAVNDAPVVVNPLADVTVDEDAADSVLALVGGTPAFTDVETSASALTYSVGSSNPALVAVSVDNTSDQVTLDYQANANGTATITVTASDGTLSVDDVFTVTVTAVNDAPVNTVPGTQTIAEDTAEVFSTANGNAISVSDVDTATVSVTLTGTNGTITLAGTTGLTGLTGNGTGTVSFGGTITDINAALNGLSFLPTASFNGAASLQIMTSDGVGGSDTDSVTINVTAQNNAPVLDAGATPELNAVNEDAGAPVNGVASGTLVSALVDLNPPAGGLDNVTDADAGAVTGIAITAVHSVNGGWWYTTNSGANWQPLGAVSNASARLLAADGNTRLYFEPNPNFNGTIDPAITFRAWDTTSGINGGTADTTANGGTTAFSTAMDTAALTVNAVNDAPTVVNPLADVTVDEDAADSVLALVGGTPVFADAETAAGALTYTVTSSDPALVAASVNNTTDQVTLDYQANANGTATVTVTASDGTLSVDDVFTVTVTAVNDAPTGADQTRTINEDTPFTFAATDFGFADVDGDALGAVRLDSLTLPPGATLQLDTVDVTVGQVILAADLPLLVFRPAPNANGQNYASFTFSVRDAVLFDTTPNSFTFHVTAVNDRPSGADQARTISEDASYTFSAAENFGFADVDGDALAQVRIDALSVPVGATLRLDGVDVTAGQVIAAADLPLLVFRPAPNANGQNYAFFDFSVGDGSLFDILPNRFTFHVTAVNDAPAGTDRAITFNEDTTYTFAPADFGFTDPNDNSANLLQAVKIASLPSRGSLTLGGAAVTAGQLIGASEITAGLLTYTPPADANGTPLTSFTFQVQDNGGTANGGIDLDPTPKTITLNVAAVADPPVANDDTATVVENSGANQVDVLTNDTDPDNLTPPFNAGLTITAVTQGAKGTVAIVGGGAAVTYTPGLNLSGPDSFTYTVSDGTFSRTADVAVSIVNVNNTPVNTVPGVQTVNEETALVFSSTNGNAITVNDPDGGNLTVLLTVANGTLLLGSTAGVVMTGNGTGTVTLSGPIAALNGALNGLAYAPTANFFGASTLTVESSDGTLSDTDAVAITVAPVADAPVAVNDSAAVAEDSGATALDVLANDTDVDNLTPPFNAGLTIQSVTQGQNGVVAITGGGTGLTYQPNANFFGSDSFTYTITDPTGLTSEATVTITVTAVDDLPDAVNDAVTTAEDVPAVIQASTLLANDTDPDNLTAPVNDGLTVTSVQEAVNGTVSLNVNAGTITFAPTLNFNGTGSFTYTITDLTGLTDTATVTVTVTAVNDAPTGADQTRTINEDTPFTFAATDFGFADVDGDALGAVRLDSLTLPPGATLQLDTVDVTVGQVILAADLPLLVFRPAPNANGQNYASFTFSVRDAVLFDTTPNSFTFHVTAVNDRPSGADQARTISEDASYTFSAAENFGFADVDGDALAQVRIDALSVPVGATLRLDGVDVTAGQVIAAADLPLLVFRPAPNANGQNYAFFDFSVGDGSLFDILPNRFTFHVTAVNDAPAGTDRAITFNEDTTYTFAPADFGFTDPNDNSANLLQAVKIASLPSRGSLTLGGAAVTAGQLIGASEITAGLLTYTPPADANGTPLTSFTFQVQDNGGTANGGIDLDPTPKTITLNVTAVNDAPTGADQTRTINEDSTYPFAVQDFGFADVDGDALGAVRIDTLSLPTGATLKLGTTNVTAGQVILAADLTTLVFTPAENANGQNYASFTFSVGDAVLFDQAPNTFTFHVTPVNDAPTAVNDTATVLEDSGTTTIAVLANDTDVDNLTPPLNAGLFIQSVTQGANGVVAITGGGASLTYTPNKDFNGTDSFTYTITDGLAIGSATVSITITPVNDAPSFVTGPNQTVNEDAGLQTVAGWATQISAGPANEGGQTITFLVTNDNNALFSGQPIVSPTGTLTYTPAANAHGVATVTVRIQDDGGTANGGVDGSAPQTFTITVNSVNDAPSGEDKTVTIDEDTAYTFGATDFGLADPNDNPANALLAVRIASLPAVGTLALNGAPVAVGQFVPVAELGLLTYQPPLNANGLALATFTFQVQDNGGTTNGGVDLDPTANTFTFNVTAVNDAPVAVNDGTPIVITTAEDTSVDIDVVANDTDVDGPLPLTPVNLSDPAHGTVTLVGGLVRYTPDADYFGPDSFTYQVQDAAGLTSLNTATVSITVTPVNDVPTFTKGPDQVVNEDAGLQTVPGWATNISPGPANESNQAVAFLISNNNTALFSGQPVISPTGVLTYTPAANAHGTATITVVLSDDGNTAGSGQSTGAGSSQVNPTSRVALTTVRQGEGQSIVQMDLVFNPAVGGDAAGLAGVEIELRYDASVLDVLPNSPTSISFSNNVLDGTLIPTSEQDVASARNVDRVNGRVLYTAAWAEPLTGGGGTVLSVRFSVRAGAAAPSTTVDLFKANFKTNAVGQNLTLLPPIVPGAFDAGTDGTIILADDGERSASQTFTITVNSVNDAPSGADKTVTIDEDTAYTFGAADFGLADPNDNPANALLAVRIASLPAVGTLALNGAPVAVGQFVPVAELGLLTYQPPLNANGLALATFTFQVQDNGGTANGGIDLDPTPNTITFNVNPVNDAPSFVKGANQVVDEDAGPQTVVGWATQVSAGPANESGQTVTFLVTNDNNALFSGQPIVSPTGTLTYTPAANAFGSATVTVRIQDDGGTANGGVDASAPQTFTITVNSVNDAPIVTAGGTVAYTENQPATAIDTTVTVTDIDSLTLTGATVQITGNYQPGQDVLAFVPQGGITGAFVVGSGILTLTGTASVSAYQTALRSVTYANTSENPSVLMRTVTWIANDGAVANNLSVAVTSTITVAAVNDAPVANPDTNDVAEDTAPLTVSGNVLTNDTDVDGPVKVVSTVNGLAANVGANLVGTYGTLQLVADGDYTYMLNNSASVVQALAVGQVVQDQFTYTVSDGSLSAGTTLTISIFGRNDNPDAVNDEATTDEDVAVDVTVLANDTDIDALDVVTITGFTQGTKGSVTQVGSLLRYTPTKDQNGADSFTYTVSDGKGGTDTATVNVTISPVNDAPVAVEDGPFEVVRGTTLNVVAPGVLGNDTDIDSLTLSAILVDGPANGTLTLNPADGSFSYTNNGSAATTDSFTYKANDGLLDSNIATVSFTVVAQATGSVTGIKFHDRDQDGVRDAGEEGLAGWTIFLDTNNNALFDAGEPNTVTDADGRYTLANLAPGAFRVHEVVQPGWRATVEDCFDVTIVAGQTATQDFANFLSAEIRGTKFNDLNGNGVRDTGEAGLPDWTIFLDMNGNGVLDGNDPFDLTTAEGTYSLVNLFPGTYTVMEVLQAGWTQTAPSAGFYTVTLIEGQVVTGRDFGNVQNVRPVANPDAYTVDEGGTLTVAAPGVLLNDTDANTPLAGLTVQLVAGGQPANGTLTLNANGSFTYAHDGSETVTDSFQYRVFDGIDFSEAATVTITVNPVNDMPVITSLPPTTATVGTRYTYDVEAFDPDPGDVLTFSLRTFPAGMTINATTGLIEWTPTHGQQGTQTVTVRVTDRAGSFKEQTFTITVAEVVCNGDLDGDGDVDLNDLNVILAARNTKACGPNDCRDVDGDGRITVLDARKWVSMFLS